KHFVDQPGTEVVVLAQETSRRIEGTRTVIYKPDGAVAASANRYVKHVEPALRNAEAVLNAAWELNRQGFRPDIMVGHNAWGETLFLKEVWPDAPLLSYFEFFYRPTGADLGFDREFPPGRDATAQSRVMNTINLLGLQAADWGQSPTRWQRAQYPESHQARISVIHDGIDTDAVAPRPTRSVTLPNGRALTGADEVITYVSRSLEPYRGFHTFMRALPEILRRRPRAQVLVIGADGVSYGPGLSDGRSFREALLAEQKGRIDLDRVHFLGRVSYEQFLAVLHVSSAHIYLTYPFVLSWSMLEAMSAGCLVIGAAVPPVMEAIEHGVNGLLVDFFSPREIADRVDEVLGHPNRMAELRARARQTVIERYDLRRVCLPRHLALIDDLLNRRTPRIEGAPAAPAATPPAVAPATTAGAVSLERAFELGREAEKRGDWPEAERIYTLVAQQKPDQAEAHYRLGLALHGRQRYGEAAGAIARAIEIAPMVGYYHCDLGVMYKHLGDVDRRLACYRRAVELDPDNVTALVNLASALNDVGEPAEGEAVCRRAVSLSPGTFSAHLNLGSSLMRLNRVPEAELCFREAKRLAPDYAEHDKNLGMCLMLKGDFHEGARIYEGRLKSQLDKVARDYPQPFWDGRRFKGKTVFLTSEQGFGDTLHLARYVPLVKARGGRVVVECQSALLPVIRGVAGADEVIAAGAKPPRFDYHRSLLSLPHVFGHRIETIPGKVPYLSAPSDAVESWRARLGPAPGAGLRVGVTWAGSPTHGNDRHRSIDLDLLRPLFAVEGAQFFSLQKGPASPRLAELGLAGTVRDLGPDIRDFGDTAAALACLDLLISVDTSVVHLAGALARPTWVMVPFHPDWRWLLDREDSPWYPTMRLYRQATIGDWPGVVARIAQTLRAEIATRATAALVRA
ncbi:MAG: tetratricopeptide repeat protein, partial [Alphaproteobacteria bacterium]|nr:tetratricopeptide repeat protein [Alphaproteobacteria bacterium]